MNHDIQPQLYVLSVLYLVAWEEMVAHEAVRAVKRAGPQPGRQQAGDQRPRSCCLCFQQIYLPEA